MSAPLALIPGLPLLGFLLNGALGGRLGRRAAGAIGVLSVAASFAATTWLVVVLLAQPPDARVLAQRLFDWIPVGDLQVSFGLLLDPLSAAMALAVTGVGLLIHVYSLGYMAEDPAFSRYFAWLNLFMASMLVLVLGSSLPVLFVGWELVGLCSYLLIGFWFVRPAAAAAGRKAFYVSRIGDAAFLLGVFLIFARLGTLDVAEVNARAVTLTAGAATAASLLLFAGATGKSAQLPLHVWLPDAMEGPTPVSALIHAATMVTAGVYMVARLHGLFGHAPAALQVVAWVGAATALFAALVGWSQFDLKRVLAWSTISQLGYMFLAAGVAAYGFAIYHLIAHAFFKALLFLAAGSVMHALEGVADLRRLGGLWPALRVSAISFAVGALALAGIWPFVGFFSKDLILESALAHDPALYAVGLLTALVTAIYITRAGALAFFAPPREPHHAHPEPPVMAAPMVVLAILSAIGGLLSAGALGRPLLALLAGTLGEVEERAPGGVVPYLPLFAGITGIALGWLAYARGAIRISAPGLAEAARRQFYVEEAYDAAIVRPLRALAGWLAGPFDQGVIDGAVNGVGALVAAVGAAFRRVQAGYVRGYAFVMLGGVVIVLAYWILIR